MTPEGYCDCTEVEFTDDGETCANCGRPVTPAGEGV